jgi:hypothetical protein
MATKKVKYVEPAEYIPKELRKKYGLGEFAKETPKKDEKKTVTKDTKKTK